MKLFILGILLFVIVTETKSKHSDEGPQRFTESNLNLISTSTAAPKIQHRYMTKEVIMYLTPTQIKALNSGAAFITSQPLARLEPGNLVHQHEYLFNLRQDENIKREAELLQQQIKPVEEPPQEFGLIPLPQTYANDFQAHLTIKPEPKQLFYPESNIDKEFGLLHAEQESSFGTQSPWIPINPIPYNKPQFLLTQNKFHLNPILEHNNLNLNVIQKLPNNLQELVSLDSHHLPLTYAPNYEGTQNIHGSESSLGVDYHHDLEKQKALAEIVAIANSLPIMAHTKLSLRKPLPESTPIFKHLLPLNSLINPKTLYLKEPKIPTLPPVPFYYSSLDLDKINN